MITIFYLFDVDNIIMMPLIITFSMTFHFADYNDSEKSNSSHKKSSKNNESTTVNKIVNRLKLFLINSTEISPKNFNQEFDLNGDLENGEIVKSNLTKFDNDYVMEGEERMIEKDIFSVILRSFGVILSDFELFILSDCTDTNPYGHKIKIDVLYDVLKNDNYNNNDNNNYYDNKNRRNKYYDDENEYEYNNERKYDRNNGSNDNSDHLCVDELSDSCLFSLRHIARQIWRSAEQLKRFVLYIICIYVMLYYIPLFCVVLCVMLYQYFIYFIYFIVFITHTLFCLYSVTMICIIPNSIILHDVIPYYFIFQLIKLHCYILYKLKQ
jgi:hypothetical protein